MPTKTTLVCPQCSTSFECYMWEIRATGRKFCSRECSADSSRGRKRSKSRHGYAISAAGYKLLFFDGKRVYEHRHVMERHLGRPLTSEEEVHHLNGQKLDNRIENLQVVSRAEHMRIHATVRGWSRNYDCCVMCGTTRFAHNCRGLCNSCYTKDYKQRKGD